MLFVYCSVHCIGVVDVRAVLSSCVLIHRVNFCVVRAFQGSISSEICDGCSALFIYITIGWKYSHRVELMCCGVVVIVGNGTYRAFGIGFTVCIC